MKMNCKELAAAIRKGHTAMGECTMAFWIHHPSAPSCGCALGAAMAGAGVLYRDYRNIADHAFAGGVAKTIGEKLLNISPDLAVRISHMHMEGTPRLEIADWLDTLQTTETEAA